MKKTKSIKINAMLNVIKVGMGVIFPLITFPYASRVLHVDNLGKVNFANSFISYFLLLASLGITTYAVREGSKLRDDKRRFSQFANEIFSINLFTSIVSYVMLFGMLFFVSKLHAYTDVIIIQSLSIIFTTLSVEWLNLIFEDYLYITIRSLIVQFLSLIGLFIFVKNPEDYLIYAGLVVFSNGVICILNLVYSRRYTKLRIVKKCNIKKHLKPILVFFSNSVAIAIYVSVDLTMLGWFLGNYYTGLYAVAVKIYQVAKQLLTAFYMVTIPKLSSYAVKDDKHDFKKLLTEICSIMILLLLPACVGLIVLSKEVIILMSGVEYVEGTLALQILAIALIFAVASGILVNCVNIPLSREKVSLKATTIAAIVNIVLNLFCIPLYKINGAAFTTVIAEFIVCIICVTSIKNISQIIDLKAIFIQSVYSVLGCFIVLAVAYIIKYFSLPNVMTLLLVIFFSVIGYLIILYIGRNPYVFYFKKFINMKA